MATNCMRMYVHFFHLPVDRYIRNSHFEHVFVGSYVENCFIMCDDDEFILPVAEKGHVQ